MLPLETARLYVNGSKQTSDVGRGMRRDKGRQTARAFYREKGLLPPEVFDTVEWDGIELALSDKPRMYKLWYGKQCTGFCGTNSKLVQWKMSTDLRCPDCNRLSEDAAHLMVYPSSHRRKLLEEQICKLKTWMALHNTEPGLLRLVAEYFRGGGQKTFARMRVTRELKELGRTQDRIGWRNFTEGKITKCFRAVQRRFLKASGASLTVDLWLKAFVSKLLGMTHSMWIF